MELLALSEMEDIPLRARREVVEGEDLPTLVEQQLGQMGADEASTARDESRPDHGELRGRLIKPIEFTGRKV